MQQIKKIEDLTKRELIQRMFALDPLCNWLHPSTKPEKDLFMQELWANLDYELGGRL